MLNRFYFSSGTILTFLITFLLTTYPLLLHFLTCIFPIYFAAVSSPLAFVILYPDFPFWIILIPYSCVGESPFALLSAIITFFSSFSFKSSGDFKSFIFPTVVHMNSVVYVSYTGLVNNAWYPLFLDFQPSGILLVFSASFQKLFFMWPLIPHPCQVPLNFCPRPPPPLP